VGETGVNSNRMEIAEVESIMLGGARVVRITTDNGIVGLGQSACWAYPERRPPASARGTRTRGQARQHDHGGMPWSVPRAADARDPSARRRNGAVRGVTAASRSVVGGDRRLPLPCLALLAVRAACAGPYQSRHDRAAAVRDGSARRRQDGCRRRASSTTRTTTTTWPRASSAILTVSTSSPTSTAPGPPPIIQPVQPNLSAPRSGPTGCEALPSMYAPTTGPGSRRMTAGPSCAPRRTGRRSRRFGPTATSCLRRI
jgi:hypothetical protein